MDGPEHDGGTIDAEQAMLGGIQSPAIDPETLKATQKAFASAAQAHGTYENLKQAQTTRNGINAQIIDNYNGKPPYGGTEIAGWQSNFSALFMTGIIDKVVPVLTGYLENVKFLTQSKIKDSSPEGQQKTNRVRELVTKTIRQWDGWRPFVSSLCQELILIGYTFAGRTDEYDWRPMHWRQDQAFVPEGTKQSARHAQVFCAEQSFLIHELTEIIQDREVAEAAKWDFENCVEALNKAVPQADSTDSTTDANNPRRWVDLVQEGSIGTGSSYTKGAKTVEVAHVMAVETGEGSKVTHLIIDRNGEHKALLWHEARFDSMRDVLTLFTLDPGNGNFYGSRGAGMRIVNYSVAMNTVVNDSVDLNRLNGLIVLQQDLAKGTPPPRIKRPFLYLNKDSEVVQQRQSVQNNVQGAMLLIDKLIALAQTATQQYIPNNASSQQQEEGKGNRTAREVTVDYQREQQGVAAFIGRFAGQSAELVGMMQRAMLNPETNDPEAKELLEQILGNKKKGIDPILTPEELKEFAESNTAEVLQDLTSIENQAKIAAANDPELQTSPWIDQKARLSMKVGAMVPQPTAEILLKDEMVDPNDEAEQIALQIGETHDILAGAPGIPVSGRHNHEIHIGVLLPDLMKGAAGIERGIAQNPPSVLNPKVGEALDHLHTGQAHAEAHIQKWSQQMPQPQGGKFEEHAQAVQESGQRLAMLSRNLLGLKQRMEAQMAKQPAAPPPGAPPPTNGAPAGLPQDGAEEKEPGEKGEQLPFTEKIATSWIAQYPDLPDAEKRRLELLTGLSTPEIAASDAAANSQRSSQISELLGPPKPAVTPPAATPGAPPRPPEKFTPPPPPPTPSGPAPGAAPLTGTEPIKPTENP